MGISRDSRRKRKATGGKKHKHMKKRVHELGRPAANTKLGGPKRVHLVRTRGGNTKYRALRLDTGNFSWGSEAITKKVRILDVVYNASNNELLRTKTLVKGCIVSIDAKEHKQWYEQHYGMKIGVNRKGGEAVKDEERKGSKAVNKKLVKRQKQRIPLDPQLDAQFAQGRLLAAVSSRPGQCGRVAGYILEGKELEFYQKQLSKKKGKKA